MVITVTNRFYFVFYPVDPWDLTQDGLRGLHCILLRKEWGIRKVMMRSRACYMQALGGAEMTFLDNSDEDSGSDMSDDELE